MVELPQIVTVEDVKNPNLLVRLLRGLADKIVAVGTKVDALKQNGTFPTMAQIRDALQATGSNPLNLQNLRGVVADPQPAGALRYTSVPTGQTLQSLRDTQFLIVKNGTGYDLYTVIGGNPTTLFKLIAGASGGNLMTTDTAQNVTALKTFQAGLALSTGPYSLAVHTNINANTTLANTDIYGSVNTGGGAITVKLPPSPVTGQIHTIKDSTGNAATNNITVDGNGNAVDAGTTTLIDFNYGAKTFIFANDGVIKWSVLEATPYTSYAWSSFTPSRAASAGTWTVGSTNASSYFILGKIMMVLINISGSSVSATPTRLDITIPASKTAAATTGTAFPYLDNGVAGTGYVRVPAGGTTIQIFRDITGALTWATSVTNTSVIFTITFAIS